MTKKLLLYVWRFRWLGVCCFVIFDLLLDGVSSMWTNFEEARGQTTCGPNTVCKCHEISCVQIHQHFLGNWSRRINMFICKMNHMYIYITYNWCLRLKIKASRDQGCIKFFGSRRWWVGKNWILMCRVNFHGAVSLAPIFNCTIFEVHFICMGA